MILITIGVACFSIFNLLYQAQATPVPPSRIPVLGDVVYMSPVEQISPKGAVPHPHIVMKIIDPQTILVAPVTNTPHPALGENIKVPTNRPGITHPVTGLPIHPVTGHVLRMQTVDNGRVSFQGASQRSFYDDSARNKIFSHQHKVAATMHYKAASAHDAAAAAHTAVGNHQEAAAHRQSAAAHRARAKKHKGHSRIYKVASNGPMLNGQPKGVNINEEDISASFLGAEASRNLAFDSKLRLAHDQAAIAHQEAASTHALAASEHDAAAARFRASNQHNVAKHHTDEATRHRQANEHHLNQSAIHLNQNNENLHNLPDPHSSLTAANTSRQEAHQSIDTAKNSHPRARQRGSGGRRARRPNRT